LEYTKQVYIDLAGRSDDEGLINYAVGPLEIDTCQLS